MRPAALVLLALGYAPLAHAADAGAPAPLVSPQVGPDRSVTFRLFAPKASEVSVAGEWLREGGAPNAPQKLARGESGVWSVTLGPLAPNIYIYVFNVDGMTIVDPVNPLIKLRARTAASLVEVPGGMPWDFRPEVAHGTLSIETHTSNLLGRASRGVHVYTPPGYDKDKGTRYPVVYLLHGNNDLAAGWTMAGRAHVVLDNLIADKKALPMIVVMPWGHALPFGTPATAKPNNNELFARYLLEEVVPLVEGKYRVTAGPKGRKRRAIVGLSMGGTQALDIALRHRDLFASFGLYGSGMNAPDFEAKYGTELGAKPGFDFIYVGAGKRDGVLPRAKAVAEGLRARNLPVTYHEVEGGHTYPTWRELWTDTAPLLFRTK